MHADSYFIAITMYISLPIFKFIQQTTYFHKRQNFGGTNVWQISIEINLARSLANFI